MLACGTLTPHAQPLISWLTNNMMGLFTGSRLHDDVIKWKHFPRYWPFVRGIHRSPVNSLHKGQWRSALMFSLICGRMNGWANNGDAGDLRSHLAHCDVIVMLWCGMQQRYLFGHLPWAGWNTKQTKTEYKIDGLVQDCSNSSVLAMELLQSCTKSSKYFTLGSIIWFEWFKCTKTSTWTTREIWCAVSRFITVYELTSHIALLEPGKLIGQLRSKLKRK